MATDHSLIYKICNLKVNVGLGQPLLYKRSKHGLGLLKFSRVPSLFRQSQKDLMGFIAVTFTFVLDFKQNNFYGDERHSVGSKLKTTNPVLKTNSVNSIHYQWHSWVNFILTLHSLATRGCSVFVIASTKLAGLAHAIS